MRKFIALGFLALAACQPPEKSRDAAAERQASVTRQSMSAADRQIGMPRIVNFARRKLLKNSYEDMDQTTLTYVYSQGMDGRFVCLGQAVGYGVSLGTQFTAPEYPQYVNMPDGVANVVEMLAQPDPDGLYQPDSGNATIVNLVNPENGEAHTSLIEPNVVTSPFKLPASAVSVPCPGDVDPTKVVDAAETSIIKQR